MGNFNKISTERIHADEKYILYNKMSIKLLHDAHGHGFLD